MRFLIIELTEDIPDEQRGNEIYWSPDADDMVISMDDGETLTPVKKLHVPDPKLDAIFRSVFIDRPGTDGKVQSIFVRKGGRP